MILEHLKESWINHISAGSGTLFSLFNGVGLAQSVLAGVLIYVVTHILGFIVDKVMKK